MAQLLKDNFGRVHNYLRISLTDKCNMRCSYCMPEDNCFLPQSNLMTAGEIFKLSSYLVDRFGISKIRFTGGEPLVRNDVADVMLLVSQLPVKLFITTNGVLLDRYLSVFKKIGLNSINVSLDSLAPSKFEQITKRPVSSSVKKNIDYALNEGFEVKINMVVMKGVNDNEVNKFAEWTLTAPVQVRFIEFMPFIGNCWEWGKVISYAEIKARLVNCFELEKLDDKPNATATSYRIKGAIGTVAFISTVTEPFCDSCNRIRITADGKLQNCLFARDEVDLLSALRNGIDIGDFIVSNIKSKAAAQGGIPPCKEVTKKAMVSIGG